jgi:DNA-binding transcriptional MerR regulator
VNENDRGLTIEELAERTGTPVRTIRFYIAERLLPSPGTRGREASYSEEHLLRLMLVRRLSERGQRLAQIRAYLEGLTLDELRALLAEDERAAAALEAAARAPSPRAYVEQLLRAARAPRVARGDAPSPPTPSTSPVPQPARLTVGESDASYVAPPPAAPAASPPGPPPEPPSSGQGQPAPTISTADARPVAQSAAVRGADEQWRRITLGPGVELHLRVDVPPDPDLVRRLMQAAGLLQGLPGA